MKKMLLNILKEYLYIFPEEQDRQLKLINFLEGHDKSEIIDWNNFDGHIVASGFIFSKSENKFLVIYHNDLKMFLYPGGHINDDDKNPLCAAQREIKEETGLDGLKQLTLSTNELIPIDIDIHKINYNRRLNLPEHYHFDFRYLFMIDTIVDIKIDDEELSNYKWIDFNSLKENPDYRKVAYKIEKILQARYEKEHFSSDIER